MKWFQISPFLLIAGLFSVCAATEGLAPDPGPADIPTQTQAHATPVVSPPPSAIDPRLREERRLFQSEQLVTARPFSYIFNSGDRPRIVWRDLETVRQLGCTEPLRVRWFDADLDEATTPTRPGRWGAYIESVAPNGTPFRRAMTFYCRPPGFFLYFPPNISPEFPHRRGPISEGVWNEHVDEISELVRNGLLRSLNDSEEAAILVAGLSEMEPLGREPTSLETAAARNEEYHLALKLKVLGLTNEVRPLKPPRKGARGPAPVLHNGTAEEAGFRPGAKEKIDAVCKAWAEDSGVPFVTLVARHGVIVTHEAFGTDDDGTSITKDYRAGVASITKTITGLLVSRCLDQGLIDLDDPVSSVLPDYPVDSPHVPTFRECLTHMGGLSGHGTWGGVRNPYLDNIILNGIDALEPGREHIYSGLGYDLVGKALEIVTGKTARRLLHDDLYAPLGIDDISMGDLGNGAAPTAWELGGMAQVLANHGSYGELELFSEATFEKDLPEDLSLRYPGVDVNYGFGLNWKRDLRPGAEPDSLNPDDMLFSLNTIGHGSLTQCLLRVDLDHDLIIVQIRKGGGLRHGEWLQKFLQTISENLVEFGGHQSRNREILR